MGFPNIRIKGPPNGLYFPNFFYCFYFCNCYSFLDPVLVMDLVNRDKNAGMEVKHKFHCNDDLLDSVL